MRINFKLPSKCSLGFRKETIELHDKEHALDKLVIDTDYISIVEREHNTIFVHVRQIRDCQTIHIERLTDEAKTYIEKEWDISTEEIIIPSNDLPF